VSSYFTVSEINGYVAKLLLTDFILSDVSVKGEAQNVKYHDNGNIYLTLRDNKSILKVVIPEEISSNTQIDIYDGKEIGIAGRLQVTLSRGEYSLIATGIEEIGIGELHKKFIELKEKLGKEGLFDEDKKRALPQFIYKIGIVTSPSGAVIHDILNALKRSKLKFNIQIFPSLVQGLDAAKNLEEGIKYFNDDLKPDIIIIARGGGSFEDLSAFNDESLARTCFFSEIPVISAVGHQTDFVITDFSSDIRAQTPTQAAEIVVNSNLNYIDSFNSKINEINANFLYRLQVSEQKIKEKKFLLDKENPLYKIEKKASLLATIRGNLNRQIENSFNRNINILAGTYNNLLKLNPSVKVSNRALIKNNKGEYINSIDSLKLNEDISIELLDGRVIARTTEILKEEVNEI